ncbi:TetR/AcrR family transcriptional regulator [Gordonia sputi]|uniref:TetR/AcrR family transcriptional regulator n=1 Tax=Gordonia sputi TaxID=36823 RepID=UPI002043C982|nr:TetR/AcrR family transcriptional regulator [Gordonia sputi]MCM3894934.1 TetR/AcrR family transcriptional regulator [Gordonia sputi]
MTARRAAERSAGAAHAGESGEPPRDGRQRKPRNTRSPADQEAAILAAAADEFTVAGIVQANVDAVASRAGVSRSTLYRRFPNKDALLLAVAADRYERGMRTLDAAVAGLGPSDAVVEAFYRGAQMISDDPLLNRLILADHGVKRLTAELGALFVEVATARIAAVLRDAGAQMPADDLTQAVEIHVRLVISYLEMPSSDDSRREPSSVRHFAATFLAPMIW